MLQGRSSSVLKKSIMKYFFRLFIQIPLIFCLIVTAKIIFDWLLLGIPYPSSINEIAFKSGVTIMMGEICGLFGLFIQPIYRKMKNRIIFKNSEFNQCFILTCAMLPTGGCFWAIYILFILVWNASISIFILILSLVMGLFFGPLTYLIAKLMKKNIAQEMDKYGG